MTEEKKLLGIRDQIDAIDQKIQALINQRAECAQQVAEIKIKAGETEHFYRPEREAQVLINIKKRNKGPLADDDMALLFREIMSSCLALEKPVKVAFLGPAGTYNHVAASKHFGSFIDQSPVDNIEEIFRTVETGQAHFGVAPIENSTEGVISHTLDLLINSKLQICGEVDLRIQHNLISNESDLKKITKVYSHQQSLAQCRLWLDANLPDAEHYAVRSNAEAVRIAKKEKGSAAIAGEMAAEIYGVPVTCSQIEDEADNTTRFIVIGKNMISPSGNDRTSLLVTTSNKAGALHDLLKPLAQRNIGMSKIESRPSRQGVWEYMFFIDIEGHKDDDNVAMALTEIEHESAMIRILGSYPKAVLK
ncbi:Chorismate mutase I / Prephenate dehydratase [hydrothermal vent metagenome]|uniref:Bifunctional chorismate mutase/prephenate dehydratase n=1 Tax=hydrothermal vent metagenome TaxID=652676 RepID=A0A3B0YGR7_9ZZZZ